MNRLDQIKTNQITDNRANRITMKKRRIGLLKKAIQISNLTGTLVQLKIYNENDNSLVEFYSNSEHDFDGISKDSANIKQYAKFLSSHEDLIIKIHEHVTKHGTAIGTSLVSDKFHQQISRELENKNLLQLFNFSNKNAYKKLEKEKAAALLGKRSS